MHEDSCTILEVKLKLAHVVAKYYLITRSKVDYSTYHCLPVELFDCNFISQGILFTYFETKSST